METSEVPHMSLLKENQVSMAYNQTVWRVNMCIFLQCTHALIIIQSLKWCHFLQTSLFCCEVRGQAQAVAACLCLHCLPLI